MVSITVGGKTIQVDISEDFRQKVSVIISSEKSGNEKRDEILHLIASSYEISADEFRDFMKWQKDNHWRKYDIGDLWERTDGSSFSPPNTREIVRMFKERKMNKAEANYKIQKETNQERCENCRNIILLSPYKQRCTKVEEVPDTYQNRKIEKQNSINLMGICDNFKSI